MQVNYLGTRLTGEVQEWFYRNVERFDRQVREWTLEMVAQGLQRRFLHTLTLLNYVQFDFSFPYHSTLCL